MNQPWTAWFPNRLNLLWWGIAGSATAHLLAAATTFAVAPWLSQPQDPLAQVEFVGRKGVVQIEGGFASPPPPPAVTIDALPSEAPVVVTPREARLQQRVYTQTAATPEDFSVEAGGAVQVEPAPRAKPLSGDEPLPQRATSTPAPLARAETNPPAAAVVPPPMTSEPRVAPEPSRPGAAPSSQQGGIETAASFSGNSPPVYPAIAVQNGWGGSVILKLWIDESGRVTSVRVERSSGYAVLDAAAVTAVRQWRGTAKRVDGRNVASEEIQEIKFRPR